jgi:CBS domain-containing protein
MTTGLVVLPPSATIDDARAALQARLDDRAAVDDVSTYELFVAPGGAHLRDLIGPPYPVTADLDDPLDVAIERFVTSRGTSLVVVDADRRPIGRILADDIVDALLDDGGLRRRVAS